MVVFVFGWFKLVSIRFKIEIIISKSLKSAKMIKFIAIYYSVKAFHY